MADSVVGGRAVGLSNPLRRATTARRTRAVLIPTSSPGTPRTALLENPAASGRCWNSSTSAEFPARCTRGRYALLSQCVNDNTSESLAPRGANALNSSVGQQSRVTHLRRPHTAPAAPHHPNVGPRSLAGRIRCRQHSTPVVDANRCPTPAAADCVRHRTEKREQVKGRRYRRCTHDAMRVNCHRALATPLRQSARQVQQSRLLPTRAFPHRRLQIQD